MVDPLPGRTPGGGRERQERSRRVRGRPRTRTGRRYDTAGGGARARPTWSKRPPGGRRARAVPGREGFQDRALTSQGPRVCTTARPRPRPASPEHRPNIRPPHSAQDRRSRTAAGARLPVRRPCLRSISRPATAHFPTQKLLKISPRTSSGVIAPIRASSAPAAARRWVAANSGAVPRSHASRNDSISAAAARRARA
jgi:hypothetical protein